jgi:tetratricopeptide (TPR) repeat protein
LDEKLSVAEELRDADKLFRALSMRVASFIEFGDRAALDASFAQFAAMRDLVRFPIHKWVLACQRAMLAILQGEFSEAESYAEAGLVAGQDVQAENAAGVYGMQMFTIRREQGRLAEIAPLLKRFVDNNPDEAVWRPGLIAVATDLGHLEMARRNFDEIADAGFRLPMDAKRSATLSYLAEACVALGDTRRAETLYRLLLPYHRVTITVGVATICCGAAARFLGMLASLMGDWQTAEEHFEAAIAMNTDTDLHAWPWLAHLEHDYAYYAAAVRAAERIGAHRSPDIRRSSHCQPAWYDCTGDAHSQGTQLDTFRASTAASSREESCHAAISDRAQLCGRTRSVEGGG